MTEIRKIEQSVVGGTILSDHPSPVQRKDHREILKADVLVDLVIGSLEKGGINGHDRLHPSEGETRCKSDRMLLRDSYVVEAIRKFF
jgi:hypothetical protein